MKHLKSSIKVLIIVAVLAAALHVHGQQTAPKDSLELFVFDGTQYVPAGEYGWDFYCNSGEGICVYYRPDPIYNPTYYAVYKYGSHVVLE